jgi:hypothetical protein
VVEDHSSTISGLLHSLLRVRIPCIEEVAVSPDLPEASVVDACSYRGSPLDLI